MKKIINGKIYDTDTARYLGDYEYGEPRSWRHYSEYMYVKRTGEFFLHGKDGALSTYGTSEGEMRVAGEDIIPLTVEMAREWAEKHLSVDDYQKLFGVIEDDPERVAFNIVLPRSLIDTIKREAASEGISASAHIEKILTNRSAHNE